MAPAAVVMQSQAHAHPQKKRAPPPGILTGLNSSTSTPSPQIASKRLPSSSASVNGNGHRNANRVRRDGSNQLLGRGQRNNSGGLRSASMAVENPTWMQIPYVKDDAYILKKFSGHRPSLILHLLQSTFRFDNQHGSFSYKSPMKVIIEHLQNQTIPHDLMLSLLQAGVMFFDGCLIVQVEDHKSITPKPDSSNAPPNNEKSKLATIHNWNHSVTVSPYIPFPPEAVESPSKAALLANASGNDKSKTSSEKDKENMPAPANPADGKHSKGGEKRPRIFTIVLYPTQQTEDIRRRYEFAWLKAGGLRQENAGQHVNTPISAIGPHPPTPMTAVPATPRSAIEPPSKKSRRDKSETAQVDFQEFDATVTLANAEPLFLEPVGSPAELMALMEAMSHPRHSAKLPSSPPRKRTIAQMAADEAAAAQTERIMLWSDDRLSSKNVLDGVATTGMEGQTTTDFRFGQLKFIEALKVQREEKAKNDQIQKQLDVAQRQQRETEARERAKQAEANKREDDKNRAMMQQQEQQRQHQQNQRRLQMVREQQAMQQNGIQNQMNQAQHGHPAANMNMPNGAMQGPQPQQRFHPQQVSQAQQASPIVRNGTPQHLSSPMVPNGSGMGVTPMQHTTSSMGGSPPRPGSAAQQAHPMAMGHSMSAQRSQQSHAGTPRMPNATPNVPNATPVNRQLNATPRMSQASPMPGNIATHMGGPMMMPNGAPMNQMSQQQMQHMMHLQQQQHHQVRLLHQQQQQQQQQAMTMSPQDIARMQMIQRQQAQAHANAQVNGMSPQQQQMFRERQYAQQVMMMQQNQMQGGGMNSQFMGGPGMGNPQMQANGQMHGMPPGMPGQTPTAAQVQAHRIQQRMQHFFDVNYQKGMVQLTTQYGGPPPQDAVDQLKNQVRGLAQQMKQRYMQSSQMAMQQGMVGQQGQVNMGMQQRMQQPGM